jgi:hypothetical protein
MKKSRKNPKPSAKGQPDKSLSQPDPPKDDGQTDSGSDERDFWLTEYQIVVDQFHKYYDIHIRAYGVFLGVTALLFGLAIEKTPHLKNMLVVFGLFFCLVYFVVLLCELTIIQHLCSRRLRALGHITEVAIEDDFRPAGTWSCYIFLGVTVLVLAGWFYVYRLPPVIRPTINPNSRINLSSGTESGEAGGATNASPRASCSTIPNATMTT